MFRDCIADIHSSSRWASSVRSAAALIARRRLVDRGAARAAAPVQRPLQCRHDLAVTQRARRGQARDQTLPYARHDVVERRSGQRRPRRARCVLIDTDDRLGADELVSHGPGQKSFEGGGASRAPRVEPPPEHRRRLGATATRASAPPRTTPSPECPQPRTARRRRPPPPRPPGTAYPEGSRSRSPAACPGAPRRGRCHGGTGRTGGLSSPPNSETWPSSFSSGRLRSVISVDTRPPSS